MAAGHPMLVLPDDGLGEPGVARDETDSEREPDDQIDDEADDPPIDA